MQNAAPQSKLHDRYQIQTTVGHGGAGEVSTAWDTQLERTVAIKRIRKDGLHENVIQSAWQEAMRLAAIRHYNIVTVYDMGVDDDAPYIVMEFVNGETVDERISQHGVMDEADFVDLARQSLEGLLAAHHAGLLHRDLKPSNLMLARLPSGNLQLKILDFGIARFLSAPNSQSDEEGAVTGSIHCIAPEILNREPVDERSDLYSLGCVFYYALAGGFPFDGERIGEVIAAHLNHEVVHLSVYRPELPYSLCEWVMALINRWPQNRSSSALQALTSLQALETEKSERPAKSGQPHDQNPPASESGQTPVTEKPVISWRQNLVWVGLAILVTALLTGWWVRQDRSQTSAAARETAAFKEQDFARSLAVGSEPIPPSEVHSEPPIEAKTRAIDAPLPAQSPRSGEAPASSVEAAPASLPAKVVLRFHGSNTIGAQLLPALLERFLEKEGAIEVRRAPGLDREEVTVEAKFSGDSVPKAIEVSAHGSKTAFEDLASQKCEVGISSRQIKPDEAATCSRAGLGDLQSAACEHVIGLDGIAIIVNPDNPIEVLSVPQLADIFSGKISDWAQVGGKPGPIRLYSRDAKSGTFDTFKTLVLGATPLAAEAKRLEDSDELSDSVSSDSQAIGFTGLPFVRKAKLIAISENGAAPLLATRFTVATEDYALSRRLFLYTPEHLQHPWVSKFVEFALGPEGQEIVSKIGFIKQTIDLERPILPPEAPAGYRAAALKAERLSVNLRFKKGSIELDNKSLRDLDRIGRLLDEPRATGRKLLLFGFTDNVGSAASNMKISKERAQAVARQLTMRGIDPAMVTSFGSALPVADNETEPGRDKNRRVEVWLR